MLVDQCEEALVAFVSAQESCTDLQQRVIARCSNLGPSVAELVVEPVQERYGTANRWVILIGVFGGSHPIWPSTVQPRADGHKVVGFTTWVEGIGQNSRKPFTVTFTTVPPMTKVVHENLTRLGDQKSLYELDESQLNSTIGVD